MRQYWLTNINDQEKTDKEPTGTNIYIYKRQHMLLREKEKSTIFQ